MAAGVPAADGLELLIVKRSMIRFRIEVASNGYLLMHDLYDNETGRYDNQESWVAKEPDEVLATLREQLQLIEVGEPA